MKKFTKVFVVLCLMLTLTLSLVACATSGTLGKDEQGRFKLAVPEVTISNNQVSWKAVRYCTTYGVKIDDNDEITVDRTFYTLMGDRDVASVRVRAIGDNEKTVSSDYSNSVSYKAKLRLANPQQPTIVEEGDNIIIRWNEIENATSYSIEQSQKIASGLTVYSSATNSFTIEKSKLQDPDVYYFRVMARNNSSQDYLPSGYSVRNEYKKTQDLGAVVPRHTGSNITWDAVENVTNYRVLVDKYSGDGANAEKIIVNTISSSSTTFASAQVTSAIQRYKDNWESKHSGETMPLEGGYRFYIQPINADHPEVYLEQEPVLVKKYVGSGEDEKVEDIIYQKPGKVTEFKIGKGDVTVEESTQTVDMLTWNCADFEKFKVILYSNDAEMLNTNTSVEEGKDKKINLNSRFTGDWLPQAGKVLEISITVQADFAEGILEGEETFLLVDGSEDKAKYCFAPESLTQTTAEGDYKDYYEIKNLGDFRFMLDNVAAGNKYYLTADIDGQRSSTNCDFYVGEKVFDGTFDGCGHFISNINIVINANSTDKSYISLFKEIADGAVFKNVTFNNVTITYEGEGVEAVALLAGTNNGTIERVNIVSSKFKTNSTTVGLVITNNGAINSCGFLSTNIVANAFDNEKALDVAAIAITNNSKIFNASIYDSEITGTTKFENARVGGIATQNSGEISNSFVKRTLVKCTTTTNGEKEIKAIAGGIVAENNDGSISECYVNNRGDNARTVEAFSNRYNDTNADIIDAAGGLVGLMNGGSIDSCYLSYARVSAYKKASGLVGDKTDKDITISNCYVYRITLSANADRSMVLAKTDGVQVQNVYCFVGEANPTNRNNAEVLTFSSDLIGKDLGDKFVTYATGDFKEEPILKNMIYSNYYSSNLKAYVVTLNENAVAIEAKTSDVGSKRLHVFSIDVNGMTLVLPIFMSK